MKIAAAIMASGLSSRMGKDKLTLKLNGKYIFEYTLELANKCDFCDFIVISNNDVIVNYCEERKIKVLKNPNSINGQSESIKLATEYFYNCDAICYFVCDQPFLSKSTVDKLIASYKKDKIFQLRCGDRVGNPVIFGKKFFDELLNLKNDEKGSLVKYNNLVDVDYVECESSYELFDIDTPDDIERASKYDMFG